MYYIGMKVPNSFNDFTVKQFVEFNEVNNRTDLDWCDKGTMLVSIATGQTVDQLESNYPYSELTSAIRDINVIPDLKEEKPKRIIRVNGKFYQAIMDAKVLQNNLEQLSTNQYVTFKELTKTDPIKNMAQILPLIYCHYRMFRKPKLPTNMAYLSEQFQSAKIGDVAGLVFFYAKLFPKLMETMQPFFDKASQTIQDHMKEVEEFGKALEKGTVGMSH